MPVQPGAAAAWVTARLASHRARSSSVAAASPSPGGSCPPTRPASHGALTMARNATVIILTTPSAAAPLLHVTFWGAARTVTGSMLLVETPSSALLLDCGLYQGKRSEAYQRNSRFPFAARDIDAVLL